MILPPSPQPWIRWSSSDFSSKEQYDAFYSALNESHLPWMLTKPASQQFNGAIDMRRIGDIRLLHCACDSCHGWRSKNEIIQSEEDYFGLLLIYGGNELVKCNDNYANLGKYGFLLWDSTRPVDFTIEQEGIKKVTLLVPQDMLRQRFPNINDSVGKTINMNCGLGAVTASHIMALGQETNAIEESSAGALVDLTLELITSCLEANQSRPMTKIRGGLLNEIKTFITSNLDDFQLDPTSLSKRFNISVRYLHMLFQEAGTSVSVYILKERLEKCRRDLIHDGEFKKNITEIAFNWGFNDSAHFCRTFKRFYGLSPRDYRKMHFQ